MSDENNNSPIEIKADLTETINNAYNDALSKPLQSASEIISTTLNFVHNTLFYPMQKYNLYAQSKLDKYRQDLDQKATAISTENLVASRVNILGPVVEGLKYNLDEEHIKDMFTNILLADMDRRKQNKVLPCYIEIVKQLSIQDANWLKIFKETIDAQEKSNKSLGFLEDFPDINSSNTKKVINQSNMRLPILSLKSKRIQPPDCIDLDNFLVNDYEKMSFIKLNKITIDNLERLKIVKLYENISILNYDTYNTIFNIVKLDYLPDLDYKLYFDTSVLQITDMGKNFIDICLN